ncbi:hypothetical protein [Chroococcidiopsis sp.]|uniref:hypothetical protein n=1 Tax=Chroococcidiopsis sp. TaxID=3088168 RepID=UPI003F399772
MQINWQQMRRLLIIFIGDIETELTFLQNELQKIRETSTDAEITLLILYAEQIPPCPPSKGGLEKSDFIYLPSQKRWKKLNYPPFQKRWEKLNCPPSQGGLGGSFDRIITHTTTWQDPAIEKELVENLNQFGFEAAIILTNNNESPYPFAYLAYLAEIPIRVGRSREFGGSVISDQLSVNS